MRRTAGTLALVGVLAVVAALALFHAREVLGHGAGGETVVSKISGPTVAATVVIDPTYLSSGRTAVRLSKGTAFSGATFQHLTAGTWEFGCDGNLLYGAVVDPSPYLSPKPVNVATLTDYRFLNVALENWVPHGPLPADDSLTPLFAQLGITIGDRLKPVITDIDNPVCTPVTDGGNTKYILSFTATVQMTDPTK